MNRWTRLLALAAATALLGTARAADVPKVGEQAPDIRLEAAGVSKVLPGKKDGDALSLRDLKGKNVVLFFYPKAMTKGCTIESCGFRDVSDKFAALDTVVL